MQKVSFITAQIVLIYNLWNEVDLIDSVVRALVVYFTIYMILLVHGYVNRRYFGQRKESGGVDAGAKPE